MALIKRVIRLFHADFHAVLDRVEEPDLLLRQAVREMEEELSHERQRLQRLQHDHESLLRKEAELKQRSASLSEELDVCFKADNENLARPLIRRQLETERMQQMLQRRRETLIVRRDRLAHRLDEQTREYESMRQKAELFDEQERASEQIEPWPTLDVQVRDEDVEVALLRERQRRAAS